MSNQKKNILYISCCAYMKGGGQESLYQLIKNLDRSKFDLHVIFPSQGNFVERIKKIGVNISIVPMGKIGLLNIIKIVKSIYCVTLCIKKYNIDLIHTDGPRVTFYAGIAGLVWKIPVIWHIRASNSEGLWDKFLTSLTTKLIFVSGALQNRFSWLKNNERWRIIYNGIDPAQFKQTSNNSSLRTELNAGKDCFMTGAIGRVEEEKGQEYFIRALKTADERLGYYKAIIIGSIEERYYSKLKILIDDMSLSEKVIFLGQRDNIECIIGDMDVIVHPSLAEAFPRVVLEAMASGKPVIASSVGGIPEAIEEKKTGYLVLPKDSDSIADRLLKLKNNKTKRLEMGRLGRERAEKMFSVKKNVEETEALYRELLFGTGKDFGDIRAIKTTKRLYLFITRSIFRLLFHLTGHLRKKRLNKDTCRNILILSLERIGDLVLALPFLESIRKDFPDSRISIMVNSYTKDVLCGNPDIDEVLLVSPSPSRGEGRGIDLLFDLTSNHKIKTAILSFRFKPAYSVGYNTNYRGFLFNMPVSPLKTPMHQKDVYLNLLKSLDLKCSGNHPKIFVSEERKQNAYKIIQGSGVRGQGSVSNGLIMAVCPGAFYDTQCWIEKRFARTCDLIADKCDMRILFLGGKKDMERINKISSLMRSKYIIRAGDYRLKDTIDLLSICGLVLCNNSGLLHIASALGIPTVSLMGPTVPERWRPLGDNNIVLRKNIPCSPCNKGECEKHECMELITVDEVVEAIDKQLKMIL